ncbi:MAG: FG-GAP-like repeat-containing protein [Candidatus Cloacimonetes bacterium]|nr:FG-GAP-like repeat-containing protein [Candidatus Cloacimonadota bacterium]
MVPNIIKPMQHPRALLTTLALCLPAMIWCLFTEVPTGMPGVMLGACAWGDYDNDGDIDILITGRLSSNIPITRLYRNDGNDLFTDTGIAFQGLYESRVAWGDYDNDNDLDILISGIVDANTFITSIYRNDGNNEFTNIQVDIPGTLRGSIEWGNYDNDGDLDLLITGHSIIPPVSKIYRNDGNNLFTDIGAVLYGVENSWGTWGDYDNDGDLDVLISGSETTKIYRNNGDNTFTDIDAGLLGLAYGNCTWGDYNCDGNLDIAQSGYKAYVAPSVFSEVYNNNGNGTFSNINAGLTGVYSGSSQWGDFDNDGDVDLLICGTTSAGPWNPTTTVYTNNNGQFVESSTSITGVLLGTARWGDYDNDCDLDVFITGYSQEGIISKLFRNDTITSNSAPTAPNNLRTTTGLDEIVFHWDSATDAQNPASGLSYAIRIGTYPGGTDVVSPMADQTGYRKLPARGSINSTCEWSITRVALPLGQTYYWSVQTIDGAFTGSPFSPEATFHTTPVIGLSENLINFGNVFITSFADRDVIITNNGLEDLVISSVAFHLQPSPFETLDLDLPISIEPGDSACLTLRFHANNPGAVSDTFFIYNNSVNQPVSTVRLLGAGVIVPPESPQQVNITVDGYNVVLNWEEVTQTIFGDPVNPDYYFVYATYNPYGPYLYIGASPTLSFTHQLASLGTNRMFYRIAAVKFYRDDLAPKELDALMRSIVLVGMGEEEVRAALTGLNSYDNDKRQ